MIYNSDVLYVLTCVDISAPTNVRATALTPYSVEVKWDQSCSVIEYNILYTTTALYTNSSSVTVNDGSTSSYTLTNLEQNTQYIITVQATVSDNRTIVKSNEVSVTTYADGKKCIAIMLGNVMLIYVITSLAPSIPPQNVMVTSTDPASLRVKWQIPSEIHCYGTITGHVIQYIRIRSNDIITVNLDSETTHIISGLVACTEYSIRVAAKTVNATGPFSKPELQVSGEDSEFNKYCI